MFTRPLPLRQALKQPNGFRRRRHSCHLSRNAPSSLRIGLSALYIQTEARQGVAAHLGPVESVHLKKIRGSRLPLDRGCARALPVANGATESVAHVTLSGKVQPGGSAAGFIRVRATLSLEKRHQLNCVTWIWTLAPGAMNEKCPATAGIPVSQGVPIRSAAVVPSPHASEEAKGTPTGTPSN